MKGISKTTGRGNKYRHGEIVCRNGKRIASPEYRSWQNMRTRCLNPQSLDWAYYGGRGITIDPAWDEYTIFLQDMGRRPSPKHTLDRKDGGGHYCKENCHWATRQQQSRNRAYVRLSLDKARIIRELYAVGGITQTVLAQQFGISQIMVSLIIRGRAWSEGVEQ